MRVLMFGWEFPPFKSGGLGTACRDLTRGLAKTGVEVTFVMPTAPGGKKTRLLTILGVDQLTSNITFRRIDSLLTPYSTQETYTQLQKSTREIPRQTRKGTTSPYGQDLFSEVQRYSSAGRNIARDVEHDIIHAHDWMTYPAAIEAKKESGKPLVMHIHATEYDRSIGAPNPLIRAVEAQGFRTADKIIANSHFLKNTLINEYNVLPSKIEVVHWGIDQSINATNEKHSLPLREKVVLFLGRMAIMKGPDHFLHIAKQVIQFVPNTKFVMVGGGELLPKVVSLAAELGLSKHIIFAGPLSGESTHRAFQAADVFVMPSVREPFGLVALEALKNNTPVIISRQSGVSEVLRNVLKVDFWDHKEMTNKIVAVLRHQALQKELQERGKNEVTKLDINTPAQKCMKVYQQLTVQVMA